MLQVKTYFEVGENLTNGREIPNVICIGHGFCTGHRIFLPNMLGVVAEKASTSGAWGLAIMGGIGFLGGAITQAVLGKIYDVQTTMSGDDLVVGTAILQYVIILTAFLSLAFLYLF